MKWMAIAVLFWAASPTAPPPTIQIAVETEALCKEAGKALSRDLGKIAAAESAGGYIEASHNLVLTSCIRIAN